MRRNNFGRGKVIKWMETTSGMTIEDIIEEVVTFGSVQDYAEHFLKYYEGRSKGKTLQSLSRTLRGYIQNTRGKDWYRMKFTPERHIDRIAKYLGVSRDKVFDHMIENEMSLWNVISEIFPEAQKYKIYSFCYNRVKRSDRKGELSSIIKRRKE